MTHKTESQSGIVHGQNEMPRGIHPAMAHVSLVLYQPEIPGNTGTLMRLAACWGGVLTLIGPLGFVWSDRHLKRARMDYGTVISNPFYDSWSDYMGAQQNQMQTQASQRGKRNIAVVPQAGLAYTDFSFARGDHLIMGSESCGLPDHVIAQCDGIVHIPMLVHARSINLAIASAIVWAEAVRQTNLLD
jgi:tRNA (cytidine/uridine-2'-O-)-methyltransferase